MNHECKLITYPNPILRSQCVNIDDLSIVPEIVEIMRKEMRLHNGVGLAAPQIGLSLNLFVVDHKDMVFINVKPIPIKNFRWTTEKEGCLSLPGVLKEVKRPSKFSFECLDMSGKKHKHTFEGMLGRIIQHETDHIFQKLIIDY